MRRRVVGVAAIAACVFLDGGGAAKAQNNVPTAEAPPYFYLWGAPPGGWGGTLSPYASQIVRVNAAQLAADAAYQAATKQKTQTVDLNPKPTDPAHVCILLQNFGMYAPTVDSLFPKSQGYNYNEYSSFHHVLDKTNPEPDWDEAFHSPPVPPQQNVPNNPEMRYLQPWNVNGRATAKQWMIDFLNAYEVYRQAFDLQVPIRFHFDTESYFSACCEVNQVRILEAVFQDQRWGTGPYDPSDPNNPNVPNSFAVPGSADYLVPSGGVEKTMWELYDEAQTIFGWPANLLDPALGIDRDKGAQDFRNRRYMLWYWEITQRAIDAAMNECAYVPIKAKYPAQAYPNLKVSNYDHIDTDGIRDIFGWHTGRGNTGYPVGQGPTPNLQPTRTSVRTAINQGNAGAEFFWSDFIINDNGTPGVPADDYRPSFFVAVPGVASGDFSSPFLYPPEPPHWIGVWEGKDWGKRYQYYLPKADAAGQWPELDAGRAALDYGRRAVESIINSPGGNPAHVVPWIRPLGQPGPNSTVTSAIDFRDMLAMLRAKKIPEVIIWWGDQPPDPLDVNWYTIKGIMERVYLPQLNRIRPLLGSCTNCPTPPTAIPVDRLRYTLRVPADGDQEFVGFNSTTGSNPQVAVQFTFGNVSSLLGLGPVALNLECAVNVQESPGVGDVSGQIYVWDPNPPQPTWRLQSFDDFPFDPNMTGFGFHAPINVDPAPYPGYYAPLWHETRRTFDGLQKFIDAQGNINIKVVLQRNLSFPFTARFDLVQLVGLPDALGASEGLAQGADFDHSQTTESYDVAAFMSAYAAGAEAADFNNDGVVNADDLTAFSAAFAAGPP